ncbi:dATP/dGTP diphosphohydrolase domain-containing protein [Pseudomonas sp.]|uniref:dATP/dGTP diphosphohydrolase domain-containing protein n=1 Tax=Pseudomonas sp. TaxID=306 RepID=UPI003FD6E5FF
MTIANKDDKIKVKEDHCFKFSDTWYKAGEEYTVEKYLSKHAAYVTTKDFPKYGDKVWIRASHVEVIGQEVDKDDKQDISRPILGERKVGKVQMDLFDSGFPNAVMEVAKVMSWAAENKGYKPHDWVNLPDADTAFSSAASRHRVKGLIQKVSGVSVDKCVDEESSILHKAHEAFNVLAELELMLRGIIK